MKNINLFTVLIFTLLAHMLTAQKITNMDIQGYWKLNWVDGGFFPSDDLIFEKSNNTYGQYFFHFEKGGGLSQDLSQEGMGECPVGVFVLKKGTWRWDKEFLILTLKGEKIADYTFDYEIVYLPKLEDNILKLGLVEVSKNVQSR